VPLVSDLRRVCGSAKKAVRVGWGYRGSLRGAA